MFFYYLNSGISNNKHELILVAVPANVAIHYFSSKLTNKWHHHLSCVCFFKTLDNFKNVPLAETRTLINKMGSLKSSIFNNSKVPSDRQSRYCYPKSQNNCWKFKCLLFGRKDNKGLQHLPINDVAVNHK